MEQLTLEAIYQVLRGETSVGAGYLIGQSRARNFDRAGQPKDEEIIVLSGLDPAKEAQKPWYKRRFEDISLTLAPKDQIVQYQVGNEVQLGDLHKGDIILYQEGTTAYVAIVQKPMHGNWFVGHKVTVQVGHGSQNLHDGNDYLLRRLVQDNK